MFRAYRAHHQERQIVSIQPLVAVTLYSRPAYDTATDTDWQLPEVVLTQFVSPDDEHDVLETCRAAFLKLWSADHKWSSGSALVVLLDWTLVQKRQKK